MQCVQDRMGFIPFKNKAKIFSLFFGRLLRKGGNHVTAILTRVRSAQRKAQKQKLDPVKPDSLPRVK